MSMLCGIGIGVAVVVIALTIILCCASLAGWKEVLFAAAFLLCLYVVLDTRIDIGTTEPLCVAILVACVFMYVGGVIENVAKVQKATGSWWGRMAFQDRLSKMSPKQRAQFEKNVRQQQEADAERKARGDGYY